MSSSSPRETVPNNLVDYIVTYGRSQYSGAGGPSTCGLAAMNCARIILLKERAGLHGDALLQELAKESTVNEVLSICEYWSSDLHLEIEDIAKAPIFKRSLRLLAEEYSQSRYSGYARLLERLRVESKKYRRSSCAVITRPPEILTCFYLDHPNEECYVIFDSHPRPGVHADGAAFIIKKSAHATAAYLADLLRYDSSLVTDQDMQWQAQLLGNFSGHLFVAQRAPQEDDASVWATAAMEASLETLAARVNETQLKTENERLKADVERLRGQLAVFRSPQRAQRALRDSRHTSHSTHAETPRPSRPDNFVYSLVPHGSGASGSRSYSSPSSSQSYPNGNRADSSASQQRRGSNPSRANPLQPSSEYFMLNGEDSKGKTRASYDGEDTANDDLALALAQQSLYDEESRLLQKERESLWHAQPFTCNICFESHSREDVAQVEGCGHMFCRECIRGYVSAQLLQHLYPIACPLCIAERGEKDPVALDNNFIQQIGLSDQEYAIFVELEMAIFSILLHCRGCDRTFFVVRSELDAVSIITCPLPNCGRTWCKLCSQTIDDITQTHSCDGAAELQQLMGAKGWKFCPGCRTPTEKISGCNHMTCTSPGCNTHFCWVCGVAIVKSSSPSEIALAVSTHYRRCRHR